MLTLFQRVPGLHALYDTPLPLLIALSLLLLPVGALLVTLILAPRRNNRGQALFLAKSLQQSHDNTIKRSGRSIGWQMLGAPRVWVLFVIFVMGYFDLSSTSLLHPTNMTPAPVLLYNRMHYGQNSVLSAQVLITVAVPVAVMIALWASMQARSLTTRIAR
jgi:ABC-type Fe3+ transport system permease subunit